MLGFVYSYIFLMIGLAAGIVFYLYSRLVSIKQTSVFGLLPYAIVITSVVAVVASGRDISGGLNELLQEEVTRSGLDILAQRLATLFLLFVSLERVFSNLNKISSLNISIVIFFYFFWFCSVISPSLFSDNPHFQHDYLYPIVVVTAIFFSGNKDVELFIKSLRNSLSCLIVGSCMAILITPSLVLETSYSQGVVAGVPRLAGLTPHAVVLGVLCVLNLCLLLTVSYDSKMTNRILIILTCFALFLSQSKTAWVIAIINVLLFFAMGESGNRKCTSIRFVFIFIFGSLLLALSIAFVSVFSSVDYFDKYDITSFTGRDLIWELIFTDFKHVSFWFGFGPLYFENFDLVYVTHGHNQVIDLLIRSGFFGVFSLILYWIVLLFYSARFNSASRGLTLQIFIILTVRSITEIPFNMYGYNLDFLLHSTLIILLVFYSSNKTLQKRYAIN